MKKLYYSLAACAAFILLVAASRSTNNPYGLKKGTPSVQSISALAFGPDGSLWVGQTDHGWVGDKGIQRIVFTGETPMDIYSMNLTVHGFDLTFTQPVDEQTAAKLDNYSVHHYYYGYYRKDDSEDVDTSIQLDVQTVQVTNISISPDRKKVSLTLGDLKPGYIYELKLENIKSTTGKPLANRLICYTLNRLITDQR